MRAALGFALGKDLRVSQGWGEGTSYNCLYGEAQPVRDTFFALNVYERVGISVVEVYKRVGKTSLRSVTRPKRTTRTKDLVAVKKSRSFLVL